jgi:hypothetical protein
MAVNSRETLKEYCLRELGDPVIEINVDDMQLEDRIDEALDYWRLYHYDGIEEMFLKQQIRASEINLTTSVASNFTLTEVITGGTSGAKATVCKETGRVSSGTLLLVMDVSGTFIAGETITGSLGHTAILGTTPITLREYDNKYLTIPDYVFGVTDVLSIGQSSSSKSMFDLQYQLRLNDLYDLTSTSIIYFTQVMQHLDLLDWTLNGKDTFRFNRMSSCLYLDINWKQNINLGDYVIVKAYRVLDPSAFTKVWNELWLRRYTTALFKKQWATNLKKFKGIQMVGGVTLDGDSLYLEATNEITSLEQDLLNKSAPLNFIMG